MGLILRLSVVYWRNSRDFTFLRLANVTQGLFRSDSAELRGCLQVDLPLGIARNLVLSQLPDFMRRYPQVAIELSSTDRRVDVVREGLDCVLRVGIT
ncbi:LysR substrate-binding domain-containing protein [Noviherbaspirillum sp.]|uniref:LysR substrate-binding domain-containing protein n=1 Tax=Noviherbaspirillum sp. TaxID=1926288 RepID=UPI0039C9518E